MENEIAETIWALEEAAEASFCAGDPDKSISFYHDQFLGWPELYVVKAFRTRPGLC